MNKSSFVPMHRAQVALRTLRRAVMVAALACFASTEARALGVLENPAEGAAVSGIGIISGWLCSANQVTIGIDDQDPVEAAYGTGRSDTRDACGDSDNGFGLLVNWNLVGDGTHTVVAIADGNVFASAQVRVTTLGKPFVRGLSMDSAPLAFHGVSFELRWQEAMQGFAVTDEFQPAPTSLSGRSDAILENPGNGSAVSGIGLISGWACNASQVDVQIDALPPMQAAYGTSRGDTIGACGDSNNGFGLLFNWNLLGDGDHIVVARAGGIEIGRAAVHVKTFGQRFLRGERAMFALGSFADRDVVVEWSEPLQNFVIAEAEPSTRAGGQQAPSGSPCDAPADCQTAPMRLWYDVWRYSAKASMPIDPNSPWYPTAPPIQPGSEEWMQVLTTADIPGLDAAIRREGHLPTGVYVGEFASGYTTSSMEPALANVIAELKKRGIKRYLAAIYSFQMPPMPEPLEILRFVTRVRALKWAGVTDITWEGANSAGEYTEDRWKRLGPTFAKILKQFDLRSEIQLEWAHNEQPGWHLPPKNGVYFDCHLWQLALSFGFDQIGAFWGEAWPVVKPQYEECVR